MLYEVPDEPEPEAPAEVVASAATAERLRPFQMGVLGMMPGDDETKRAVVHAVEAVLLLMLSRRVSISSITLRVLPDGEPGAGAGA